jgi:hypothetical protein
VQLVTLQQQEIERRFALTMSPDAAAFQTLLAWDDDDDDDDCYDEFTRRRGIAGFVLGMAVIARQRRKQRRRDARAYLTRPSLPPVPRADSAWAYLYSARIDKSFIVTILLKILAKKYNW